MKASDAHTKNTQAALPIGVGILVAGLIPILYFWICFGRVPEKTVAETRKALVDIEHPAILVDVREKDEFKRHHIQGSLNWPFSEVMKLSAADQIPPQFKGRTLFLICDAGLASAWATRTINAHTDSPNFNVRGGLQAWAKDMEDSQNGYNRLQFSSGAIRPFPIQTMSVVDQWFACAAAFFVKPLYMLLSLVLIWVLRRQNAADLKSLRWAMVFFFAGESFCALNYIWFNEDSYGVEYLHIFGMLLAFGFTIHAVMEGLDVRIMRLRDPNRKCAAIELCPDCIKYKAVPCGFSRGLLFLSVILFGCSAIPLMAGIHHDAYRSDIFGTLYLYNHPAIFQYFELRYAPFLAMLCFTAIVFMVWKNQAQPSPLVLSLFAAGAGVIGFAFFRMVLYSIYRDQLQWFVIWEELTELLYILATVTILWMFRSTLFQRKVS